MRAELADNLLLSVPQIDREHLELIARANEFSDAVDREASRAELELRLTQLVEGFQDHFDSEEGLMRSHSFPGLKAHADEHRRLIVQLSGLRDDLSSGVLKRCFTLVHFVRRWTEEHIEGADTNFAHFLHEGKAPEQLKA